MNREKMESRIQEIGYPILAFSPSQMQTWEGVFLLYEKDWLHLGR